MARVLVHAFALLDSAGKVEEAAPPPQADWAAVYLHDLARTHDGVCHEHGANAVRRFAALPALGTLLERGGVRKTDYPAIETAVAHHCRPAELSPEHPHWRLTALLKDADGLDRVRLGDLDTRYLRFPESVGLIPFSQRLYTETEGQWPEGDAYFEKLWPAAQHIMAGFIQTRANSSPQDR